MAIFWKVSPFSKRSPLSKTLYLSSTFLAMACVSSAYADPLLGCSSSSGAVVCKASSVSIATVLNPIILNGGNILGWNGKASSITITNGASISATMMTSGGTIIGNGSGYNINNVTIDKGASIASTGTAISLGSNANIDINGTVSGSSSKSFSGPMNMGPNIIEFNGNTTVNIGASGRVIQPFSLDSYSNGEAFNPAGGGNRIINRGLIQTSNAADIWFQGTDSSTLSKPNYVENYGTITAGNSGTGQVLGASGKAAVDFFNYSGGIVNGNITLSSGAANEVVLYNGSVITGKASGGGNPSILVLTGDGRDTLGSNVSKFGTLTKNGTGTWVVNSSLSNLSNNLTTSINGGNLVIAGNAQITADTTSINKNGTLQIGNNDNGGSIIGKEIVNNGTLSFNRSDAVTVGQVISGTGSFNQNGAGTTTLTGTNTYGGPTTISSGTLQVGDGGTEGSIASSSAVINNGTLTVNRSDAVTVGQVISGTGSFNQNGTGTTVLTGANTYSGATNVNAGVLQVDGQQKEAQGLTSVASQAALSGSGVIGGSVVVNNGGILSPGDSINKAGMLRIEKDLNLAGGSVQNWDLGQAYHEGGAYNDLVHVGGNLNLSGTLNVLTSEGGSDAKDGALRSGIYRLYTYDGQLTGQNGEKIGTVQQPSGISVGIQTSIDHQVNLMVQNQDGLNFWKDSVGGDGIWSGTQNSNNEPPSKAMMVFEGDAGNVTVKDHDSSGNETPVTVGGMQFANNDGKTYRVSGDPIYASQGDFVVRVGDGTVEGAGVTAVINSVIDDSRASGGSSLTKTDAGTLILGGDNRYQGDTIISDGKLQLGDGGTTGSVQSKNIKNDGVLSVNRSDDVKLDQNISGSGSVSQDGSGKTIIANDMSYTGDTSITKGILQLGDGGTTGSVQSKNIKNDGVLSVNRSDDVKLDQNISGSGSVSQDGSGKTIIANDMSYTGDTSITKGILQLGDGGTTGSVQSKNIKNDGVLSVNRSDEVKLDQNISGSGSVSQDGSGKTIIANDMSYTGDTSITKGILQLGDGGTTGSVQSKNIKNDGVLSVNRSDEVKLDQNISGSGSVSQDGSGKTIIANDMSYTGDTSITKGILQLGDGGTTGSVQSKNIKNDGVLSVNRSDDVKLDQNISGSGSVSQDGSGKTIIANDMSYTGDTSITKGILQLGDGGTTGSVQSKNIKNDGVLSVNRSDDVKLDQNISGSGSVSQDGSGKTIIANDMSYTGDTSITKGILQLGDGGTTGSVQSKNIKNDGVLSVNRSDEVKLDQNISGSGSVSQDGSGKTIIANDMSYTGDTSITKGILQLGDGGTTGSVQSKNIKNDGVLSVNRSDEVKLDQNISGSGSVSQDGSGKTIIANDMSYTGDTSITKGILQLGDGGTTGSLQSKNIKNDGVLSVNRSDEVKLDQNISGSGGLVQEGAGKTILSNNNSYDGPTSVNAGTLQIDGDQSGSRGPTTVASGATLAGNGTVGGDVVVHDGGVFSPGNGLEAAGSMTINGNMSFDPHARQEWNMGQVSTEGGSYNDFTHVKGDLKLGGTFNVSTALGGPDVQGDGSLGGGVYRMYSYDGTLSGHDDLKEVTLNGVVDPAISLQTSVDRQVNLIVGGGTLTFWDGGDVSHHGSNNVNGNKKVDGGDGIWTAINGSGDQNWTSYNGQHNAPWTAGAMAIFQGDAGNVTVKGQNAKGKEDPVTFRGIQFANLDGRSYVISGDALHATTDNTIIRVGDGTSEGAGITAEVDSVIDDHNLSNGTSLTKTDAGTLVLGGDNTYRGDTIINGGTLQLGNGGTTGSVQSKSIVDNATLAMNHSDDVSLSQNISGTGSFRQEGSGTTTMLADNTYQGDTTISNGTLRLGNGDEKGSIQSKNIINNGILSVDHSDDVVLTQKISGSGSFHQDGSGRTVFLNDNTYQGSTIINQGTLQLGDGGETGAVQSKSIVNNGQLIIDHSDNVKFDRSISGTGSFIQAGSGKTILSADNTYSGDTVIMPGSSLEIGNGATKGSISASNLINDGTLYINRSDSVLMAQTISGSGDIIANGQGHMTMMTENNTYTGEFHLMSGTIVGSPLSFGTGAVVDDALLIMNKGGIMKDELRGSGTFVADAAEPLHLPSNRDDSGFTGQVKVNRGVMRVDGNLRNATMSVSKGATLTGGGYVGKTSVGEGGTISAAPVDKSADIEIAPVKMARMASQSLMRSPRSLMAAPRSLFMTSLFAENDVENDAEAPAAEAEPQETISPLGVMTVSDSLTMDRASQLSAQGTSDPTGVTMEVNGKAYEQLQSSVIKVLGRATLNGGTASLNVSNGANLALNQGYTLLTTTQGVTGRFDNLITNLGSTSAFMAPGLAYTANDVDVIMQANGVTFASVAQTSKQAMVGNALQQLPTTNKLFETIQEMNAEGARRAMPSLAGDIHASARTALIQDSYYVRQAALDRLDSADCDGTSTNGMGMADLKTGRKTDACLSQSAVLWGQAYGSLGNNSGTSDASSMHHSTAGFVMGADAPVFSTWRVGGLVSYGHSMFNLNGVSRTSGRSDNITLGGYAGNHWGNLHLRMGASYTWNIMSMRRSVTAGAYNDRLNSNYLGGTAQAFAELGYKLHAHRAVIEPFANVAYVNLHTDGYREHGGDAALRGKGTDTGVTFSTFGMRASTSFTWGKTLIMPQAMFAYRHAFGLRTPSVRQMFAGASGGRMDVTGVPLSSNSALLKLGVTAKLTNYVDVGLSYIGQYGNHSVDSGAEGHVKFAF